MHTTAAALDDVKVAPSAFRRQLWSASVPKPARPLSTQLPSFGLAESNPESRQSAVAPITAVPGANGVPKSGGSFSADFLEEGRG